MMSPSDKVTGSRAGTSCLYSWRGSAARSVFPTGVTDEDTKGRLVRRGRHLLHELVPLYVSQRADDSANAALRLINHANMACRKRESCLTIRFGVHPAPSLSTAVRRSLFCSSYLWRTRETE